MRMIMELDRPTSAKSVSQQEPQPGRRRLDRWPPTPMIAIVPQGIGYRTVDMSRTTHTTRFRGSTERLASSWSGSAGRRNATGAVVHLPVDRRRRPGSSTIAT